MKERLIGAAVLVALAVWLIPWVLDGPDGPEPVAEAESDALELPAAQSSTTVRTQTIQLDETREPPTPAARSEVSIAPNAQPAPAPSQPAHEPSQPAPEPSQPAPEPAARTLEPGPSEEEDPPEPTVGEEPAAPPSPSGEAWMVQIGSFSEEENARRLAERVATYGFAVRVSTFATSGRPMFRVRVGPESSRERAVAVASSLSAHGFVAQVVSQD